MGNGAEASSLPRLKIWKDGNPPSADKTCFWKVERGEGWKVGRRGEGDGAEASSLQKRKGKEKVGKLEGLKVGRRVVIIKDRKK